MITSEITNPDYADLIKLFEDCYENTALLMGFYDEEEGAQVVARVLPLIEENEDLQLFLFHFFENAYNEGLGQPRVKEDRE